MTKTLTTKTPATSKALLQTIEAVRAWAADTLSHLGISWTRYDVGFHSSLEGFGNALHLEGFDRLRQRDQIVAGLLKRSTKTSRAQLQNIEAVRQYLDEHLLATKNEPPDRLRYGREDGYWLLWSMVAPMGYEAGPGLSAAVECS
jgi:hypothetical protein